jgi:hypothetical protein
MVPALRTRLVSIALLALVAVSRGGATASNAAEQSIQRFLEQDDTQHAYRATRHLEAENGSRKGWLQAVTEYSPATGFRFQVTNEGGSEYIRTRVLRAVLEGERDVITHGETARSSLALANYSFQANGIDSDGLVNVRVFPRRKERVLLTGTMFLNPAEGNLVRLEGRLAKNPSLWVNDVNIVRTYERIGGAVLPVALKTTARVRFLGEATLDMRYVYDEIDGQPVTPAS